MLYASFAHPYATTLFIPPQSLDSSESMFSESFVERLQWLGTVVASPLVGGVRYISCRMALDSVLRPQMARARGVE